MEIVIPPRDHKPSTYRYTWDENGEVEKVERVNENVDYNSRQTVQWPFRNSDRTDSHGSTPLSPTFPRRATWQPRGIHNEPESPIEKDLVPDYVINYMRGETPETMAVKRQLIQAVRGLTSPLREQQRHVSRAADFYFAETTDNSRTGSTDDDCERILRQDEKAGNRRVRLWMTGWRGGIAINTLITFLILVVAIVCLVLAITRSRVLGGESAIYTGSCAATERLNSGLRVIINILVVILLAIANYVFQILSSPTRTEVAGAHDKRTWLDIGIPSVRNLRHITTSRVCLIAITIIAAVSTQIMYNAIIFTSRIGVSYDAVFVTEDFLSGAPFSNATDTNAGGLSRIDLLGLQASANRKELRNLTAAECFDAFGGSFQSQFSAVLLVTNVAETTGSLVQTGMPDTSLSKYIGGQNFPVGSELSLDSSLVQYCLARPGGGEPSCSLTLSGSLLGVVAVLNLVSVITLGVTGIVFRRFVPLATLGDALGSFLSYPDHTTRQSCLLTKSDVRQGRWGSNGAKYWAPKDHFWLQTPSIRRWLAWLIIWAIPTALTATALGLSINRKPTGKLSSFGSSAAHEVRIFPEGTSRAGLALLSSLPHILLAALYLATNALLSTYFLSHELSQFAIPGSQRPLRVSTGRRKGTQTASLFLTLPRPWSWLLLVLFAATGFVLSQSVFVVSVEFELPGSDPATRPPPLAAVGTSGVGLLTLLVLLVTVAAVVMGLGLRRADPSPTDLNGRPGGNPLVLRGGSCSAVISARCHRIENEVDIARHGIAWGVVREGEGMNVGHATFSARPVQMLNVGKTYE